jgi:hypothetical protein
LLCIVPFCTIPKAEALHFVADAGAFRSTQTPESDRKYKVTINPSRLNQQIVSTDFGIVFQHPEDQVTFRCFAMDSSMKASNGKDFYIVLDQLPDYVFKDGDIVSGKCCLLSSVDEDVGCVAISFHGTVKVRFVLTSNTNTINQIITIPKMYCSQTSRCCTKVHIRFERMFFTNGHSSSSFLPVHHFLRLVLFARITGIPLQLHMSSRHVEEEPHRKLRC